MANQFTASIPNNIIGYMNCRLCQSEMPEGMSPEEYSWVQAGITEDAHIQVWCIRHEATIALVDDLKLLKQGFDHNQIADLN